VIVTWSKGPADDDMPESILVENLERVRRHPWWTARAELALAILRRNGVLAPARILDVGCGWGVNLRALEKMEYEASGLDISRRILELIDEPQRRLIEADLNQTPPETQSLYEGLLMLDVLEHLDDDRGTVGRLAKLLRPGGIIVVSVPALPELFSEFDQIQGHRRRYVPETLSAVFEGTGFVLTKIFWWGAWMVPVLRRMRLKPGSTPLPPAPTYSAYLRLPPWPGPLVMKLMFGWEKSRALDGRLRTGSSLFAVGTRAH
jgi:SAM-dependent methyltransferase